MRGVTIDAAAQARRDVAASLKALRRPLECAVRESTRLGAEKRTPPDGQRDGDSQQDYQRTQCDEKPFPESSQLNFSSFESCKEY